MTADEIRATQLTVVQRDTDDGPVEYALDLNLRKFEMLREIAAQLAELNAFSKSVRVLLDQRGTGLDKPVAGIRIGAYEMRRP